MRSLSALACLAALFGPAAQAAPPAHPVVLLGASVVAFWTDTDPAFFAAHPDYLDMGRAGEPLASTSQRAADEVMPLKPKVVVVVTGGVSGAPERTPRRLQAIVELAKIAHAKVVVAGSPAIRPETLALIRAYAAKAGVTYADFADMRDPDGRVRPGMTYDGVHPTAAGYALMGPVVAAAVDRALATP